jgi:hypothetical protein
MPPLRRGAFGFQGVRPRPNGTFYAELHASGYRLTLGTYTTMKLATRVYDTAAWRFRHPRRNMNFLDVESLEEAEFLAPPPPLLTDADHARHRQEQRRLAIAERDERLMQQGREEHPCDVQDEEAFYAAKREERRADRHRRREFAEQKLENPFSPETFDSDGPMWNDLDRDHLRRRVDTIYIFYLFSV